MTVKRFNNNQFSDPSLAEWAPALHRSAATGCWVQPESLMGKLSPSPSLVLTPSHNNNNCKPVSVNSSLICRAGMLHFIQTWNNSSLGAGQGAGTVCIINFQTWHGRLSWHIKATADHLQGVQLCSAPTSDKKQQGANTSLMSLGSNKLANFRTFPSEQRFCNEF